MTQLYRDMGARKPGTLSRVGLGIHVDPRDGGGRMNERATDDIVRLMPIDGEAYLSRAVPQDLPSRSSVTSTPCSDGPKNTRDTQSRPCACVPS